MNKNKTYLLSQSQNYDKVITIQVHGDINWKENNFHNILVLLVHTTQLLCFKMIIRGCVIFVVSKYFHSTHSATKHNHWKDIWKNSSDLILITKSKIIRLSTEVKRRYTFFSKMTENNFGAPSSTRWTYRKRSGLPY